MHTEEKTKPLKAEDGADFVATLEATAEGPQAYFTVTCERRRAASLWRATKGCSVPRKQR
jgi:hypothetical protein